VDAIPVMELKLDSRDVASDPERTRPAKPVRKPKRRFEVAADETLGDDEPSSSLSANLLKPAMSRSKKSLLEVDSSGLSTLSLSENDGDQRGTQLDFERRQAEEEEMARAMKEVERLRLEMQRAQERIETIDASGEGTIVKRKKKKKPRVDTLEEQNGGAAAADGESGIVIKKKKKKKRKEDEGEPQAGAPEEVIEDAVPTKTKRKKKRQVVFDEGDAAG
jgi:AP-3 complex subunit delta